MIPEKGYRERILICSLVVVLFCLGASPKQSEVPPQAFFADYFSGTVVHQGSPPPQGTELMACIRDCLTFESERIILGADGLFTLLEVNPADRFLRGDRILFYLVNAHGKIKAGETAVFEGKYGIVNIDLNFDSSLPAPMSPARLPDVGDPILPLVPGVVIGFGAIGLVVGLVVIKRSRKMKLHR